MNCGDVVQHAERGTVTEASETLGAGWQHDNEQAFEDLFVQHYNAVFRVLYNLLGNREEAEDAAQETFLALHSHPPDQAAVPVVAWLFRVALNRGYNTIRGEQRAQQRLQRAVPPAPPTDPQAEALRAEERARVRAVLARLPERQSHLLLLRYSGLSYAEIAAVLGLAPSSIGTLLTRAERAFLAAYDSSDAVQRNGFVKVQTP